ncbi:MAG TPA: aminotransferase class I/II-fold pyridoxal phosphate-dependent enzyme [Candidatus Polarisedimenticolia bacterium]|nr:aminotransferase class I/II-fold pyridoxal phosphate-dependent enzyme [Candidatus Polarisedimenticolia bacterium]
MTGPLDGDSLRLLATALERLQEGFAHLPPSSQQCDAEGTARVLLEAAERMRDNFPYFHPLYAGQMLKPPHPVARLAYALSLWINPNNHALDGGRASSAMEKEAVAELARMFGWREHLGHLCGGGTMASLEALWAAGRLRPDGAVAASSQAHYTHARISAALRIPFEEIPCDARGRMDPAALAARLERGGIATVVATLGTTAAGAVDPLHEVLALRERHGFRLHVDAAYGGYFTLAGSLAPETRAAFDRMAEADSIVIDPHKHGLQPYGCGCVLFRDPAVGALYRHDSPYTYFTSRELHLGEISLECSRPGAAAVALWATQRLLPLVPAGAFARGLDAGRRAALELHRWLAADPRFAPGPPPELDIVTWIPHAGDLAAVSALSRRLFEEAAARGLHLALAQLPAALFPGAPRPPGKSAATVTCLRSVLMKPEHAEWLDRIEAILDQAAGAAGVHPPGPARR